MLKCCATLATPAAAIQQVSAVTKPFLPAELPHVKTGKQRLPLETVTLERC